MAKLIYSTITSLDGYVEDARGNFDWGRPDDELHAFVNDLARSIGTIWRRWSRCVSSPRPSAGLRRAGDARVRVSFAR